MSSLTIERLGNDFGYIVPLFSGESVVSGEYRSGHIPVGKQGSVGLWYKATAALGNPNLRIYYEVSYHLNDNYVAPSSPDVDASLTDQDRHVESIGSPPMPYMRIVIEAKTGNASDTKVDMFMFNQ